MALPTNQRVILLQPDTDGIYHEMLVDTLGQPLTASTTNPQLTIAKPAPLQVFTPTITVGSYSVGQNVGGLLTLTNAARANGVPVEIRSIHLTDHSGQGTTKGAMTILVFNSQPTQTFTDHSAMPTLSLDTDARIVAALRVLAGDWDSVGGGSGTAVCTKLFGYKVRPAALSTTLYAAIVIQSTPTYTNTADLNIFFDLIQD